MEMIADEDARLDFPRNPRLELIQILGCFGLIARHELVGQLHIFATGRCASGHGGLLDTCANTICTSWARARVAAAGRMYSARGAIQRHEDALIAQVSDVRRHGLSRAPIITEVRAQSNFARRCSRPSHSNRFAREYSGDQLGGVGIENPMTCSAAPSRRCVSASKPAAHSASRLHSNTCRFGFANLPVERIRARRQRRAAYHHAEA
jgi:hypothetical protein